MTVGIGGNRVVPTASISDATGVEGEVLRFEVTLSRSSDTPVTVRYETATGAALEGTDYDAASGTLTFGVYRFVLTGAPYSTVSRLDHRKLP